MGIAEALSHSPVFMAYLLGRWEWLLLGGGDEGAGAALLLLFTAAGLSVRHFAPNTSFSPKHFEVVVLIDIFFFK